MWRGSNPSHALTLKLEAYGDDTSISNSTEESSAGSDNDECESPVQCNRKRKRSGEDNAEESEESGNTESDMPEVVHQMEAEIERQLDSKPKKSNLTVSNVKNIIKCVITNKHVLQLVRHTMQQTESNFCVNTVLSFTPKLTRSKTKELLNTFPSIAWPLPQVKSVSNSECKVLIEEELPEDSSDEEYRPENDQDTENLKSESDIFNDCDDDDDDDDDDEEEQDESDDIGNLDDAVDEEENNKSFDNTQDLDTASMDGCVESKIDGVKSSGKTSNGNEDDCDDDDDDDDDDECRLVICDDVCDEDNGSQVGDNYDSKEVLNRDTDSKSVSFVKTSMKENESVSVGNVQSKDPKENTKTPPQHLSTEIAVAEHRVHEENICQRTRSKLCLSDTPLEAIESAFMPPDITTDMYDSECDDDNWKNFLKGFTEPLKPNLPDAPDDDDDETDPEYNVMAEEEEPEDKEELREDPDVMVPHKEVHALMAELFEYSGMLSEDFDSKKKINMKESNQTFLSRYDDDELNDIAEQIAGAMEHHSEENEVEDGSLLQLHHNETAVPVSDPIPHSGSAPVNQVDHIPSNDHGHLKNSVSCKAKTVSSRATVDPAKMSFEQKLLLDQLMRKYVQLRTQHFFLAFLHPKFHVYAMDCKQYLITLKLLARDDSTSAFYADNLEEALHLIEQWEKMHESDAVRNRYMNAIDNEIESQSIMKKKKQAYTGKFPPGFCENVIDSTAFLYPSLLPTSPFRCEPYNTYNFFPSEDNLIALGLELFMSLAKENPKVWGKATLYKIVPLIVEHFTPARKESTVYSHILECSKSSEYNPIKYYLENGRSPRTIHFVIPFSDLQPPSKMPLELLPTLWKNFLEKH